MKKLLQPLLIVSIFFITLFFFDTPAQYTSMRRSNAIKDSCMLSDVHQNGIIKQINEEKPDIILLGNSMLGEGVGDLQLSQILGRKTIKMWRGGSASAWWYLAMKNILPQCTEKPRYIGIFFRDTFLTLPKYRVTGKYKIAIDNFAYQDEKLLDLLAYQDDQSFVKFNMKYYLPLYRDKTDLKNSFDAKMDELVGKISGVNDIRPYMKSCFAEERMNKELVDRSQFAAESLNNSEEEEIVFTPSRSFLPHIIEQSKKMGVHLFFVRVKRICYLEPNEEPEEIKEYMKQLSAYFADENIPFLDFTHEPEIQKEHYASGDHLNRKNGRKLFTSLLAERMEQQILLPQASREEKPSVANRQLVGPSHQQTL